MANLLNIENVFILCILAEIICNVRSYFNNVHITLRLSLLRIG